MKYLLILLFLQANLIFADSSKNTFDRLNFIQKKIGHIYFRINEVEDKIKKSHNGRVDGLESELKKYQEDLDKARDQFYSTAAGIDYTNTTQTKEPQKKLLDQFQELLSPLLDSIRNLSERPRQIQQLKKDLENVTIEINRVDLGLSNLEKTQAKNTNPKLELLLKQSKDHLQNTKEELKIRSQAIDRSLKEISLEKRSMWDKTVGVIRSFLGTKGRNLFLSFLVFSICLWFSLYLKKYIFTLSVFKKRLYCLDKPLRALYGLFSAGFAIFFALLCLYLLNDWVLVTIIVLLLSSILWSLKQYAPKFIEELKLIFNLGTVREGQRIIWKGVPWKVKSLGLYSILINEDLQNLPVKVAAKELLKEHSRPVVAGEPWFPTKNGEWLTLSDGTFGKVVLQTPEQVIIELLGNSRKYYHTEEFLKLTPHNLSKGFRLEVIFGLDYQHQSTICSDIIETVDSGIRERLEHRFKGHQPDFKNLLVDFHSAGASSLNLWVKADCNGHAACDRSTIEREIQKALVEICNKSGYTIPFNQMTIHMKS